MYAEVAKIYVKDESSVHEISYSVYYKLKLIIIIRRLDEFKSIWEVDG